MVSDGIEEGRDRRRQSAPLLRFALELQTARTRQRVVLRAASRGGVTPLGDHPSLMLQAVQRRVERSRTHLEDFAGDLLDAKRDAPSVHRLEGDGFQDQEIQRALEQVSRFAHVPLDDRECSDSYSQSSRGDEPAPAGSLVTELEMPGGLADKANTVST
jgi:hypothetical protein